MEYKLKFSKMGKKDLSEIASYYEKKQVGLGKDFMEKVKEKNKEIKTKPERNPADENEIRKVRIKRFPYYIYYLFKSPVIIVIAIWHTARLPFSRKERLEETN